MRSRFHRYPSLRPAGGLRFLAIAGLTVALTGSALAAEVTYQYFRFKPLQLKGGGNAIQLSEFEFYLGATKVPVPVGGVSNPGGSNDGSATSTEKAEKVIDNLLTTKWYDGNKQPLVFNFGTPVTVDSYRFGTGNDAPDRDPVAWRIEGSTTGDDASWVPLDQQIGFSPTLSRSVFDQKLTIAGQVVPYINSFEIFDADGGTVGFPAKTVFAIVRNGQDVTAITDVENSTSLSIAPSVGQPPTEFGSLNFTPVQSAQTTYTLSASNGAFGGSTVTKQITVRSSGGGSSNFRYVKFTATALRSGPTGAIQLDEFEFFSTSGTRTEILPIAVTNPGGSNDVAAGEGANNLINGASDVVDPGTGAVTHRKWFDGNKAPVIFDFGDSPAAFDTYRFTTANDFDSRDPVRWTLEGSNDNSTWQPIDSVTTHNFPTPNARFTETTDIPLNSTPPPVLGNIVSFTAERAPDIAPSAVEFKWVTTGATTVSITPSVGDDIGAEGSIVFTPTVGTTYTLSAVSGAGTVTKTLTVPLVTTPPTGINYPDFSQAGTELILQPDPASVAAIVNDYPQIATPGDSFRLRVAPDLNNQQGVVWYGQRISLGGGFDTSFGMGLATIARGYGAEGLSFIVQNTAEGTASFPTEKGPATNALTVNFSSWDNTAGVLNEARVNVYSGATRLGTTDLRTVPGITLHGGLYATLTGDYTSPVYAVRVVYVPGDLDVYIDGIQVITDLNVNLGDIGAADAAGTAVVGFASRCGGWTQASDITSWTMTSTPGPGVSTPLVLTASSINASTGAGSFTWISTAGKEYRITASSDLVSWATILAQDIPATGTSTTKTFTFTPGTKGFFRVEEE